MHPWLYLLAHFGGYAIAAMTASVIPIAIYLEKVKTILRAEIAAEREKRQLKMKEDLRLKHKIQSLNSGSHKDDIVKVAARLQELVTAINEKESYYAQMPLTACPEWQQINEIVS